MRKVVDTNYQNSPKLREYLSDPSNFAVVTDYTFMEALQGKDIAAIHDFMEILSDHPKQVVVTKNIAALCVLKTRRRSRGLQKRLVDRTQTGGFAAWSKNLDDANRGDKLAEKQILDMRRDAAEQLDFLLGDMETYAANLKEHEENYTEAELAVLRKGEP